MSECRHARPFRKIELELGTTELAKQHVHKARTRLQAYVAAVFEGLIEHKCLTKEPATAIPHTLKVVVRDQRDDKSTPLSDFNELAKKTAPR